jgi:hypothetical protein
MKKYLMMTLAVLVAVAVAMPAFAVEFKYGGLYRLRYQSKDNLKDGHDKEYALGDEERDNGLWDDNGNWIDQRLRMYFTFIASERLQVVTKWEADTLWGNETPGAGRHGGGDVGADATNLEMKNAYIDFMIPNTPTRAKLGVQGITLMEGWLVSDDFSAAVLTTPLDPVEVMLGYIAARNEDVFDEAENIDDWVLAVTYGQGPFSAAGIVFYQYGHDNAVSTSFADGVTNNHLVDLGVALGYKMDMVAAKLNFIKNFGSYDHHGEDVDYEGWMINAGVDFFVQNFTLSLGGFYTSGDNDVTESDGNFAHLAGRSYYWSEMMGLGTLDANVGEAGDYDRVADNGNYRAWDGPSNLWTITAGVAWQALETTKLTFNYYYIGTADSVVADEQTGETDDSIGHELNLYLDQDVVDGLKLRLVGAYLFADDAFTVNPDDDDAYELGAQLQWAF